MKRRDGKTGEDQHVSCPAAVRLYNQYMGGVDLADNLRRAYTFSLKSRRWYMRIFWYLIESSCVNAHILQMETTGKKLHQVNFRRILAEELITKFNSRQRPGKQAIITAGRYRERHFPSKGETRRQCEVQFCKKKTWFICRFCERSLCCVPCFEKWHTRSVFFERCKFPKANVLFR